MIQRTSNFIGLSSKAFYEGHSRKEALHECNAIPRPLLFPRKKASKNKLHSIFSTAQFITWSSNDILLTVDVSSSLKFL